MSKLLQVGSPFAGKEQDIIITGDPGTGKSMMAPILIADHLLAHPNEKYYGLMALSQRNTSIYLGEARCS